MNNNILHSFRPDEYVFQLEIFLKFQTRDTFTRLIFNLLFRFKFLYLIKILKQTIMKKLLILAVMLVGFTTVATAQNVRFGFKGGLNFANIDSDTDADSRTGYHLGAALQLSLAETFAIQPEVLYSAQGADDFDIDYLNVPILAKLKFAKFFSVEAGPQFGFLVNEDDNIETIFGKEVESFDISGAVGAGIEFGDFFGQLRYNFGLTDIIEDADAKNSNFQISVGYYIF